MEKEINAVNKKIKRVDRVDDVLNWILRLILIAILAFAISFIYDAYRPDDKSAVYHNGDTWITMTGTNIDYPVVRGKDNFEYLDKDPQGNFYAGGSIFLDYRNKSDFSDSYNVVYGHNMAGGKMFADLKKYYEQDFFDEHPGGMLFTPKQNYALKVIGIYKADAYASGVYGYTSVNRVLLESISKCKPIRSINLTGPGEAGKKILALSTCSSSMDDSRDVLFCTMTKTDKEYADIE